VCDLETARIGAPCIYDVSSLRVKFHLEESQNSGQCTEENLGKCGIMKVVF
jgi:hypothetical protein